MLNPSTTSETPHRSGRAYWRYFRAAGPMVLGALITGLGRLFARILGASGPPGP
jgi:hypothetical protein